MKLVEFEQGTPEWLAWRSDKCTASEAPIIMGAMPDWSPVKTWDDLRADKIGLGPERDPSGYLARVAEAGHKGEERIRPVGYVPICIESTDDDHMAASLDGFHPETGNWCEIKTPAHGLKSKMVAMALPKDKHPNDPESEPKSLILPHIWWQLVHQAAVIGSHGVTGTLIINLGKHDPIVIAVPASVLLEDWPLLREQWLRFLAGEMPGRCDSEWIEAVRKWRKAKDAEDYAKALMADAKAELLALGDGEGGGVKVMTVERKGTVSWQSVAKSLWTKTDAELKTYSEDYRGASGSSTTIKEVKT